MVVMVTEVITWKSFNTEQRWTPGKPRYTATASALAPAALSFCIAQYVAKELRKQEPDRLSQDSEGTRTKFLECPSNVKIKQRLLAAVVRVAKLLVQTKVWVKPSLRLKPDTIGGSAESQKAKGISCNHLLSCFLFHKLRGDQVLRCLCHFP